MPPLAALPAATSPLTPWRLKAMRIMIVALTFLGTFIAYSERTGFSAVFTLMVRGGGGRGGRDEPVRTKDTSGSGSDVEYIVRVESSTGC